MPEHDPRENHILDALPVDERDRLFPHMKVIEMPLGMVLYESGAALRDIYFPIYSIVSLLYVLKNGASAEIAVVGNDGAIGVALFMGGETTPNRAVVQSAGSAYRLSGRDSKTSSTVTASAAAIAVHPIAVYPNGSDGGLQSSSLGRPTVVPLAVAVARPSVVGYPNMTQELMANMLGVRREGVTMAAGKLQHLV